MAFALVGLAGCDRDDEASLTQLRVNFNLLWDADPFTLGQSGLDVQARPVQLERLECFVSAFALHDQDRGWIEIDTIKRVNFIVSEPHAMLDILTEGDLRIDGIRMGLGVPADQNKGVDPASYPSNHPLGARGSAGMHWGWAAGYIFSVYEGRMQTDPEVPFAYHAGNDMLQGSGIDVGGALAASCGSDDTAIDLALDAYKCCTVRRTPSTSKLTPSHTRATTFARAALG